MSEKDAEAPDFTDCTNIEEVQLRMMAMIGYVQKKGEVKASSDKGPKYKYAKESDVLAAVRPLLLAARVTYKRISIEFHPPHATMVYRFKHLPSGSYDDIPVIGDLEGGANKGGYKAMTGSSKYALLNFLLIETGDDPEKPDRQKKGVKGAADGGSDQDRLADGMKRIRECETAADLTKVRRGIEKADMPEKMKTALLGAWSRRESDLKGGPNG